jgi:Zn-dependent metalloprotease
MKKINLLLFLFIVLNCINLFGQNQTSATLNLENKWILFDENSEDAISESEFDFTSIFSIVSQITFINNLKWELHSQRNNPSDNSIVKVYQQYFQDIPIEGGQMNVLFLNNKLRSINGNFIKLDSIINTISVLSEFDALGLALDMFPSSEFAWEPALIDGSSYFLNNDTILIDEIVENGIVIEDSLGNVIYLNDTNYKTIIHRDYPIGQLIFTNVDYNSELNVEKLKLAFKFNLISRNPYFAKNVYVDALTGNVLKSIDLQEDGTVNTLYNGTRNFNTKWTGSLPGRRYILHDESRGIRTYEHSDGNDVHDFDNDWSTEIDRKDASAHWSTQATWDYFQNELVYNGIDGGGLGVTVISNTNQNVFIGSNDCNAQWNKDTKRLLTGDIGGNNCDSYPVSLDLIAHEYVHGIVSYNFGGFDLSLLESKALSESFSDILACGVENYVLGFTDWIMFHDWLDNWNYKRKLDDPNYSGGSNESNGCPSYYQQPNYWISTTTGSNAYGHVNSGVQNHWFYLLSQGGYAPAGSPNPNIVVTGIGIENASKIAFYNLIHFMQPTSNYFDARNGSILSAIILFGICSEEVEQTINAWNAVGVSGGIGSHLDEIADCSQSNTNNTLYALRKLESNCDLSSNSNYVSYKAGTSITLYPGFKSNSNFSASIDPCLAYSTRSQAESSDRNRGPSYFWRRGLNTPELPSERLGYALQLTITGKLSWSAPLPSRH